ncbi:MAG: response regulator, partial [Candidatus Alcyoniella australis]|nr:response regulator [Candidatus Alcyoniella australis]
MNLKRVLIGEHDHSQYEALSEFFAGREIQTVWVTTGQQALERFDETNPDLVLIDALLVGMPGVKVIQRLREKPGGGLFKAVLMSSAYRAFQDQYEHLKRLGVDSFLAKPVDVTELERLLRELFALGEPEMPIDVAVGDDRQWISRRIGREGTLAEVPLGKLLYTLYKYERNGALRMISESVSKIVYISRGNPVFVTSNLSNESLGRYLLSREMITTEQYNASLQQMISSGKQHGAVLIEMGVLTPHQLYTALIDQIKEKILKIFAWDDGEYHFTAGDFELDKNLCLSQNAPKLVLEGIRRYMSLQRLEEYFRDFTNVRPVKTKTNLVETGQVVLKPSEMKYYRSVGRQQNIGRILSESSLTLTESLQLLYFLITIEAVVVDRRQQQRRRRKREVGDRRSKREILEAREARAAGGKIPLFQKRVSQAYERYP